MWSPTLRESQKVQAVAESLASGDRVARTTAKLPVRVDMNKPFILSVGVLPWVTRTAIRQFTKRVLRRGIRMRLPTGTSFMIPRNSLAGSTVYITQADVDYGSEALLARLASKRTGFLDVGANIGYYSAYMAPGFSFVYAFEPDARAFEHLVRLPS